MNDKENANIFWKETISLETFVSETNMKELINQAIELEALNIKT